MKKTKECPTCFSSVSIYTIEGVNYFEYDHIYVECQCGEKIFFELFESFKDLQEPNIKWTSTKEKPLPRDGSTYLIIWKGQFALAALDFEDDMFWVSFLPNQYDIMLLDKERENKISHWTIMTYPKEMFEIKKNV